MKTSTLKTILDNALFPMLALFIVMSLILVFQLTVQANTPNHSNLLTLEGHLGIPEFEHTIHISSDGSAAVPYSLVMLCDRNYNVLQAVKTDAKGKFLLVVEPDELYYIVLDMGSYYLSRSKIQTPSSFNTQREKLYLEYPVNKRPASLCSFNENVLQQFEQVKRNLFTTGVHYQIQLGTYDEPKSPFFFPNVTNVCEVQEGLQYSYTTGDFSVLPEAQQWLATMKQYGFDKAVVVAFYNGRRVVGNPHLSNPNFASWIPEEMQQQYTSKTNRP